MVKFAIATLAFFLATAATTEALKCYVCGHAEKGDIEFDIDDKSCKAGKKPKDEFSTDCASISQYMSIGEGRYLGIPKNSGFAVTSGALITSNQLNSTFTCVKATMDGKIIGNTKDVKAAIRSCLIVFNTNDTMPDLCYADDNSKIQSVIKENWMTDAAREVFDVFTGETKVGLCSCSSDECSGALSSVSVSGSVLLATTLAAFIGKFL